MPLSPHPLITLTTDFGTADHFVGVMKGVIAGLTPHANVVDISHEVAQYDIVQGAFVIAEAWRYFPKGTIHVVVIDPGVGSSRRPILAEATGHFFVAPDNGVLSLIYDSVHAPAKLKVRVISNTKLMARDVSRTFHGRDIFAPAAARLAHGVASARFGGVIDDFVRIANTKPFKLSAKCWRGIIFKADRFGNLISNFHIDDFGAVTSRAFEVRIGEQCIRRLALTFSEASIGELVVVVGSSGYLEIAANQASAAQILGCGSQAPVELEIF